MSAYRLWAALVVLALLIGAPIQVLQGAAMASHMAVASDAGGAASSDCDDCGDETSLARACVVVACTAMPATISERPQAAYEAAETTAISDDILLVRPSPGPDPYPPRA